MIIFRRYRNLHLQKIHQRETRRLQALTKDLQQEVELKNAEMLTQASFIIQKNELIQTVKNISVRVFENNRYRLRKKMNLDANQNLNEFILSVDL